MILINEPETLPTWFRSLQKGYMIKIKYMLYLCLFLLTSLLIFKTAPFIYMFDDADTIVLFHLHFYISFRLFVLCYHDLRRDRWIEQLEYRGSRNSYFQGVFSGNVRQDKNNNEFQNKKYKCRVDKERKQSNILLVIMETQQYV